MYDKFEPRERDYYNYYDDGRYDIKTRRMIEDLSDENRMLRSRISYLTIPPEPPEDKLRKLCKTVSRQFEKCDLCEFRFKCYTERN